MRKLFVFLILAFSLNVFAQRASLKNSFHVLYGMRTVANPIAPPNLIIAIGGQSNAGTRGTVLTGTPYESYQINYPNTHYIDNLTYPSRVVYNKSSGGSFGAEIGIVNQIYTSFSTIEIIKWYQGGTAISNQHLVATFYPDPQFATFNLAYYDPGNTSFFQTKLAAISQSKPHIILWIQGEEDAAQASTTYLSDLTLLVKTLRDGYGDQKILFLYNQLHVNYALGAYPVGTANVRAAQAAFQSPINIMINMDDVDIGDPGINVHYNSTAIAEMGKRFANAIKTYYHIP